jgi:hypothetical protein
VDGSSCWKKPVTVVYLRYWASEPLIMIRKAMMMVARNKTGLGGVRSGELSGSRTYMKLFTPRREDRFLGGRDV